MADMPDDLSSAWDAYADPDYGVSAADRDEDPNRDEPHPASVEPRGEGVVPLGHDRGIFYYFSLAAGQVYGLSSGQHTKASLMAMASLPYHWETLERFQRPKSGLDWDAIISDLMTKCRDVGIYDADRVRGRGVWLDKGRSVLHLGDRLIVNGRPSALRLPDSTHVYEASQSLGATIGSPLPTKMAYDLVGICTSLRWDRGINGVLLAGFIAIAPVCGGLAWRPSIWVVGGAGTGKTYIQQEILIPTIGGMALQVQSKTSEAGIRQSLGSDARPVIFDEAEAEDAAASARLQGVLDLVRQAASEGGADIVKGSADGRAKRYRIRSSFAFFSINASIMHEADAGRITVLGLRAGRGAGSEEAGFQKLRQRVMETVTPDFSAGLVARSVQLLPVIRANAETFAQAVSVHLGSRRTGDQLGTLLAGAYSLHSEKVITPEDAAAYVAKQDWSDAVVDDAGRDEIRLLAHLTSHRVRFSAGGNGGSLEASIGRLITAAIGHDSLIGEVPARAELLQIGIKYERTSKDADGDWLKNDLIGVQIATNHPSLARILSDTPWSKAWSRALLRLPETSASTKNVRFGPGVQSKATWVPMSVIDPDWQSHGSPRSSPSATY